MTEYHFPYVPRSGRVGWPAMNEAYPWLQSLSHTPQDAIHHGEGDVGTHTRMVLEALIGLPEWQQLGPTDREILFWAALLHDIAKPMCTTMDADGRIQSAYHTVKGERLAHTIMYKGIPDPVPFGLREKVAKLVRYHGLPLWLVEQDDPKRKIILASQSISLRHLALLAEADARGRICDDMSELLDRIQLFRQYASDAGCYDKPYPFASDLARYVYFSGDKDTPSYVPYDTCWGEVILMSGLPGAGKDTWIAANADHLPMISLDHIRSELKISPEKNQGPVIHRAKDLAKEMLRHKQPFVWNATNVTRHMRRPLIDMMASYGARVNIIYIESAYADLIRQNAARENPVGEAIIEKLIAKLDIPMVGEAHAVLYCCS